MIDLNPSFLNEIPSIKISAIERLDYAAENPAQKSLSSAAYNICADNDHPEYDAKRSQDAQQTEATHHTA